MPVRAPRLGHTLLLTGAALGVCAALLFRVGALERLFWTQVPFAGRPYLEHRGAAAAPLAVLLVLHAYDTAPLVQERFFEVRRRAKANGWLVVLPEGATDSNGKRYWNAGPACCAFDATAPDDTAHLLAVLADVRRRHQLSPTTRTYALGVSNGAFMAQRLACEPAAGLHGVLSVAGTSADTEPEHRCRPLPGTALLHVHGTLDEVIRFEGGSLGGLAPYASARMLVERWASRARCTAQGPPARMDFDARLGGAETEVLSWSDCEGGAVTFLRVEGGEHQLHPTDSALDWMERFLRGG